MRDSNISADIKLTDNSAIKGRADHYDVVDVDVEKILKSWRDSLFAYEWMTPDGDLKSLQDLPDSQQEQRQSVEAQIQAGDKINRPVLGIGLMENVEIGAGKAEFLTLSAHGYNQVSVHIPKSNREEFEKFIIS